LVHDPLFATTKFNIIDNEFRFMKVRIRSVIIEKYKFISGFHINIKNNYSQYL
jgi:hypothetical protein